MEYFVYGNFVEFSKGKDNDLYFHYQSYFNLFNIMKFSRMYKYHRRLSDRYRMQGITVISSVQIEHYIVGICLAIVIVLISLFVLVSDIHTVFAQN